MKPLELKNRTSLETGLSQSQVQNAPVNRVETKHRKSTGQIIASQLFSYFNLVNYLLAAIVIFTGSWRNLLFMLVVIANTFTALYQEFKSRRILDRLALVHQQKYQVLRSGKWTAVPLDEIVQGDIIRLSTGSQIPCDGVIRQGFCQVNESPLTGESDALDRKEGGSLYGGCFIVSGTCEMQAVLVGNEQYMATVIREAKREKQYPSQLRDSLNAIIKFCSWIIFPAGLLLFAKQYFHTGLALNSALLSTTASMVGMIPEGLIILTTAALMTAAVKMARQKVLIQELYCTENLARVDLLCLDKTGTITSGKMNVVGIEGFGSTDEIQARQMLANLYGALEDDNLTAQAIRQAIYQTKPTEKAERTFPFSSSSKCSGAVFGDQTILAGAYSFVFSKEDPAVVSKIEEYASQGLRVLAIARAPKLETLEKGNYELCGLVLIEDELRPDARRILDYFKEQDVDIKIISGDMPETVAAIARKAGVEGKYIDMSTVSDDEIPEAVDSASIFGRVSPVQKKLMVEALQAQGHTVAMTGDGVNDVMALRQADCSIAMGSGAQAAMSVASMVLLQDQFAALPGIVLEGRRVINNIQRTASLFLVKTLFSFMLSVLTVIWMSTYPFLPIQLTLVSSLGTGMPAFILTFENSSQRIRGHFLISVLSRALPGALAMSAGVVCCYCLKQYSGMDISIETYRTICTCLAGINALCVLYSVCRPLSLLRLLVCLLSGSAFVAAVIFIPSVFMLAGLDWLMLGLLLILAAGQVSLFIALSHLDWTSLLMRIPALKKHPA